MPFSSYKTFNNFINTQITLWDICNSWAKQCIGLSLARIEVLKAIESTSNCRVNDISQYVQITVGAASKIVDKLQLSGHIQRRPNPVDSRSSIISLTQDGKAIIEQTNYFIEPFLESYFEGVDQEKLAIALNRIKKNIYLLSREQ